MLSKDDRVIIDMDEKDVTRGAFVCIGLSGGLCVVYMTKGGETVAKDPSTLRDDRVRSGQGD
jgi:hypothetical protein